MENVAQTTETYFAIPIAQCTAERAVLNTAGGFDFRLCYNSYLTTYRCGSTSAHCGPGCVSGCNAAASSAVESMAIASSTQGSDTIAPTVDASRAISSSSARSDGRCGPTFENAPCDASGPYGGCCSQYGYCGKTDGHCLVSSGCISGCSALSSASAASSAAASVATSAAASLAVSTAQQDGTTSTQEPVIAPATSTATGSTAATGLATTDGTCGASNDNTVCGDWAQGSCCSMYGFCGNTTAHCGDGCQSGPCLNGAAVKPPGPSPAPAAAVLGSFKVVGKSGVPAMHAGLMPNGKVIFLDKVSQYCHCLKVPR